MNVHADLKKAGKGTVYTSMTDLYIRTIWVFGPKTYIVRMYISVTLPI
jgi:hypothetical protein